MGVRRKTGELERGGERDALCLVEMLLRLEHALQEELLQLLVGRVDEQLLERVAVEDLEAEGVEQPDPLELLRLVGTAAREGCGARRRGLGARREERGKPGRGARWVARRAWSAALSSWRVTLTRCTSSWKRPW